MASMNDILSKGKAADLQRRADAAGLPEWDPYSERMVKESIGRANMSEDDLIRKQMGGVENIPTGLLQDESDQMKRSSTALGLMGGGPADENLVQRQRRQVGSDVANLRRRVINEAPQLRMQRMQTALSPIAAQAQMAARIAQQRQDAQFERYKNRANVLKGLLGGAGAIVGGIAGGAAGAALGSTAGGQQVQ